MFHVEYTQTKGPSQKPINLTKVFGISSNTPNSDTARKKWHNEAISTGSHMISSAIWNK